MRAVRDTFGAPRPGDRTHQGVDIFAPRGTPVVSTTRGLVARIGENSLGGTVVWVLGPGGDRHYYAHLNSVADIKIGQRLCPATCLARSAPPVTRAAHRRICTTAFIAGVTERSIRFRC